MSLRSQSLRHRYPTRHRCVDALNRTQNKNGGREAAILLRTSDLKVQVAADRIYFPVNFGTEKLPPDSRIGSKVRSIRSTPEGLVTRRPN